MAQPTIILRNTTGSAIDLVQLAVSIPAAGSVTVTDFDRTDEVLNDEQLSGLIDSGDIEATLDGDALTSEQTIAQIRPLHALDIKHDLGAVVAPTVTDDADAGYQVGSIWIDTVTDISYLCLDDTAGAAIWGIGGSQGGSETLSWGARLVAVGKFARVNGTPTAASVNSLDVDSEHISIVSGMLAALSWNSTSADAATVVKIYVNGIVEETITLSGLSGTDLTLNTMIVSGDKIAVEYDSGSAPGESTWNVGTI